MFDDLIRSKIIDDFKILYFEDLKVKITTAMLN